MKIGIYCGSFSPVHKGHIKIVKEILKSKLVDKVLLIPTKAYWDKKISISLKHRTNMLKLYENKKIIVEEKLSNTKCTYEVFTKAEKEYKNDELYLIVGADNLPEFEKWIEYKKLLEYPFIIIQRESYNKKFINNRMKELNKKNYTILNIPKIDISSSYIRNNINNKKLLKDKIDNKVYNYLIENSL